MLSRVFLQPDNAVLCAAAAACHTIQRNQTVEVLCPEVNCSASLLSMWMILCWISWHSSPCIWWDLHYLVQYRRMLTPSPGFSIAQNVWKCMCVCALKHRFYIMLLGFLCHFCFILLLDDGADSTQKLRICAGSPALLTVLCYDSTGWWRCLNVWLNSFLWSDLRVVLYLLACFFSLDDAYT